MSSQTILKGSQREHPKDSIFAGKPHPDERATVTCVLRRKHAAPRSVAIQLSHEDFAATHGCDIADIHAVENFAAEHHFTVDRVDNASRTVKLSGNLHRLAEAFGAALELRQVDGQTYRTRSGGLTVPAELNGIVIAILGFDQRPAARTYHQLLARAGQTSYTPGQVAKAYNFPSNTGAGQTIAVIELGGGYNPSDLATYGRQRRFRHGHWRGRHNERAHGRSEFGRWGSGTGY